MPISILKEGLIAYGRLAITAGHFHFFHRMPALIAERRGYFKQEGLMEVEITVPGEDELSLRDLKLGRIDIELGLRATVALRERRWLSQQERA